jgi:hypothetical protein
MAKIKKEDKEVSKKEILELAIQFDRERHEMKLKELSYIRETERFKHANEMERQRIKSAEIRKDREYRENKKFAEGYPKYV